MNISIYRIYKNNNILLFPYWSLVEVSVPCHSTLLNKERVSWSSESADICVTTSFKKHFILLLDKADWCWFRLPARLSILLPKELYQFQTAFLFPNSSQVQKKNNILLCICKYASLFNPVKWSQMREMGEENRFADFFILLWTIYWQIISPWEFLRNWTFVTIIRTKKIKTALKTYLQHLQVCETNPKRCFLNWKPFLLNSWKTFKKLPFTEYDFSNVASATLNRFP